MCGISGLISLNRELTDKDHSTVKRMSDSISHRGPDQQKIERFDKVIFATEDIKSGAVVSNGNLLEAEFANHLVKFKRGPLQKESSDLLKKFFRDKRSKG